MADSVDTITLVNNYPYVVVRLNNECDGTGESNVVKLDKSAYTDKHGREPRALDIERIWGHVSGFNYILLEWDHTTDDQIAVLKGSFDFNYAADGGPLRDPMSAGGTGDVLLTTDGNADGNSYDIYIRARMRADD